MNTSSRQITAKRKLIGRTASLVLAMTTSCSASDEAPKGGRVEHPMEPTMKTSPPPLSIAPSSSVANESSVERELSPADKAIAQDYPPRPWSKNVPERACTKDQECGDGFCDRGRCAAIWTSAGLHGQRCTSSARCVSYLCLDGRCRSCVSDAECIDGPDNQDPLCIPKPFVPGSHGCVGVVPSREGDAAPSPVHPSQKK